MEKLVGDRIDFLWQKNFTYYFNKPIVRGILYIVAVILVIGWLLGIFVYSAKGLIHILIVLAIIALLLGVIRRS
jgi:membrane-bound ClpP family serine protease